MNSEAPDIGYKELSPRRYYAADQYNLAELLAMDRSRALAYLVTQLRTVLQSPDTAARADADLILLNVIKVAGNGKRWAWYADQIIDAYRESKL